MTDARQDINVADDGVHPTAADEVTDPSMAPVTDDASGQPEARGDESPQSEEEAAAQLGDFA